MKLREGNVFTPFCDSVHRSERRWCVTLGRGGSLPLGPGVGVSAWLDTYPQVVRLFRIYFCRVRVHLHYIMDCTVLFSFCMFNLWRQSFL